MEKSLENLTLLFRNLNHLRSVLLKEIFFFTSFTNSDFQVSSRKTSKPKPRQTRKICPTTRRQIELATSDNNTRTRVSNQSAKLNKIKQIQNKISTSNTVYLAGDESMFIPSDTSDISDWEWIAGGFPCRYMIRKRLI